MADNKKYYYLKLKENFFDSEEMIILQSMQDGYIYSDILMKLYLRSLKNEGKLMFKDVIPYTPDVLATVVRHQVGTVEKALDLFRKLGLVEVLDNGAIYMMDIQNFIGESSTEADRKRQYRAKIEQEKGNKIALIEDVGQMSGQMSSKCPDKNPPELEIELEIEKEIDIEIEKDIEKKKREKKKTMDSKESSSSSSKQVDEFISLYHDVCKSLPKVRIVTDKRKKAIKTLLSKISLEEIKEAFEIIEKTPFLKGDNDRGWKPNIEFLVKHDNIVKILEGFYDSSSQSNVQPQKQERYNPDKVYEDNWDEWFQGGTDNEEEA